MLFAGANRIGFQSVRAIELARGCWHSHTRHQIRVGPLTYRHTLRMLRHMRTTVRLNDGLLEKARREAARRGITLTALIEQGLRLLLTRPGKAPERQEVSLPVCRRGGGTLPGVVLSNSADLLDRMEGRQ